MIYFQVRTPLGFVVTTTADYWGKIVTVKHPSMRGRENDVQATLADPDEIRRSRTDRRVFLFYRRHNEIFFCVVVKKQNSHGFVITTYMTEKIKEGESLWQR